MNPRNHDAVDFLGIGNAPELGSACLKLFPDKLRRPLNTEVKEGLYAAPLLCNLVRLQGEDRHVCPEGTALNCSPCAALNVPEIVTLAL